MKEVATRKGSEVAVFDPRETAGEIHITDAAAKAAERAKDFTAFESAIRKNLTAKRDFAADYSAKFSPGQPRKNSDSTVGINAANYCRHFGFIDRTVQRWCEKLLPEGGLEKAITDTLAIAKKRFIDETEAANFSSESVEWYTPKAYIEAARECLGEIELDPASSAFANKVVRAKKYFTAKQDGIEQDWFGRVFMNPPYGKRGKDSLAGLFCNKAIEEFEAGRVKEAIILVNSVHSQEWQRPLWQLPVCLVDHRIQFVSGDGEENKNPTFQNAFFYLGSNITKFKKEFAEFGYVLVPA